MTLFADEYLNKIASGRKQMLSEWEKTLSPQKQEEQDLVRRAQAGDMMAYRRLKILYSNNINSAIRKSGLNTVVDHVSAQQIANAEFRKVVNNYDPVGSTGNFAAFNTYATRSLEGYLQNAKKEHWDFGVRKSAELTEGANVVHSAIKMLKKEGRQNPTPQDIYNYIQANFPTGKGLSTRNIERIMAYERNEFSASQVVGGSEVDSGMTWADAFGDQAEGSGTDAVIAERIIGEMPQNQQRFLKSYFGIGPFKNNRARNMTQAVLNGNLTHREGTKVLSEFRERLKRETGK